MKGKPLQVNCVQLAPFLKLYKGSPIQSCSCVKKKNLSFHCIQNNLFKSQAQPETYHAKMFLAQAEKLTPDLVLIGTGQSNTQTREMLAVTAGSSLQVLLAGFM